MPDTLPNVVRAGSRACFGAVAACQVIPRVHLEIPDTAREEAGSDKIEEAGRDYEKDLQRCCVSASIDHVPDGQSSCETRYDSERYGRSRDAEAHAANEDNSLQPFPQDGDEGQHEHGVLFTPHLESVASLFRSVIFGRERSGQLDSPLCLQLRDAEEGRAHYGDDKGCKEGEDAFPDELDGRPAVSAEAVKGPNETTADDDADGETSESTDPYLQPQPMSVRSGSPWVTDVSVRTCFRSFL